MINIEMNYKDVVIVHGPTKWPHVEYITEIRNNLYTWNIRKRYHEYYMLRKQILKFFNGTVEMVGNRFSYPASCGSDMENLIVPRKNGHALHCTVCRTKLSRMKRIGFPRKESTVKERKAALVHFILELVHIAMEWTNDCPGKSMLVHRLQDFISLPAERMACANQIVKDRPQLIMFSKKNNTTIHT